MMVLTTIYMYVKNKLNLYPESLPIYDWHIRVCRKSWIKVIGFLKCKSGHDELIEFLAQQSVLVQVLNPLLTLKGLIS